MDSHPETIPPNVPRTPISAKATVTVPKTVFIALIDCLRRDNTSYTMDDILSDVRDALDYGLPHLSADLLELWETEDEDYENRRNALFPNAFE